MTLRLGTRGSALALAQSGLVASALTRATGREADLIRITTPGDRSAAPIERLGVGVFVSALRDALLAKEIDFAVHSYKDLPTAPADGLVVAAVPPREDPRDALVARDGLTLLALPSGARVGTGAVRRIAQLRLLGATTGPELVPVPIRGNVDTRLAKVASGELDAVILAGAGLSRLGRLGEATELLDPTVMLPAPAQGALAVECRADDAELLDLLGVLDDPPSRATVEAERALLAALEAGCSAPVAALATWTPGGMSFEPPVSELLTPGGDRASNDVPGMVHLRGAVFRPDGQAALTRERTGTPADAVTLGRQLAAELRAAGADHALGSAR